MNTMRARIAAAGLLAASLLGAGMTAGATLTASATLAASTTVEGRAIAGHGTVLVASSNSMTVYTFTKDTANSGTSACTAQCLTNWPALTVAAGETPTAGAGVTGTLGTITRSDNGQLQVTYNGLPLYFFHNDAKPGDTNGNYPNWNLVVLAAATPDVVGRAVSGHGTILVAASNDMTVYTFTKDTANSGTSACTGQCLTVWPPVTVAAGAMPTGGAGVTGTLGTITRSDTGATQITYNGLPLYFFHNDAKPGDTNGNYPNWNLVVLAAAATPAPRATATPQSPTLPPTSTGPASTTSNGTIALAAWLLVLAAASAGTLAFATRIARRNR